MPPIRNNMYPFCNKIQKKKNFFFQWLDCVRSDRLGSRSKQVSPLEAEAVYLSGRPDTCKDQIAPARLHHCSGRVHCCDHG